MYLLVGLGNPGSQYEGTRHNIGFAIIERLAEQLSLDFTSSKWQALTAKGVWDGHRILLAKPQTFMNLSGDAVAAIAAYYHIDSEQIIVIHDDLDLACGQIKLAFNRGHGGHNGLKSINARLKTAHYNRLRFGIGRPQARMPVDRYVLSRFSSTEEDIVSQAMETALRGLHIIVNQGLAQAMQEIHSLNKPSSAS